VIFESINLYPFKMIHIIKIQIGFSYFDEASQRADNLKSKKSQ